MTPSSLVNDEDQHADCAEVVKVLREPSSRELYDREGALASVEVLQIGRLTNEGLLLASELP